MACNDAAMRMWEALAKAGNLDPSDPIRTAELGNTGDDSTWRMAERTSNAQLKIALMVLAQDRALLIHISDHRRTMNRRPPPAGRNAVSSVRRNTGPTG